LYLNLPSASFSLQVCRKRAVHCDHFQFLLTVLLKRSHQPLFCFDGVLHNMIDVALQESILSIKF